MSSSGQPRFRDVKTSTPPRAHPGHVGSFGPRLNNYSLNLKGGQGPAATYKVWVWLVLMWVILPTIAKDEGVVGK